MSKTSKRPGRAARDIHATIRADAEALKASPHVRMRNGEDFPELNALLYACRDAVVASLAQSVIFEGRRYFMRCRLTMRLDVFANPGEADPLASAVNFSSEPRGHAPGH